LLWRQGEITATTSPAKFIKIMNLIKKIWTRATRWFRQRRECSWHHGYMGGNPYAKNVTHGVCRECSKKFLEGI